MNKSVLAPSVFAMMSVLAGCSGAPTRESSGPSAGSAPQASAPAPAPSLPVAWVVDQGLATPESAYFDLRTSWIFVANVDGDPTSRDGNGYISKLSMGGKVLDAQWLKGLNAPKGLRSYRDKLYATDIDEVVQIDIKTAKVDWKIKIQDAAFLNDIAVSNTGVLYISDTFASRIYVLPTQGADAKQLSLLQSGEGIESPNGLLFVGNSLVVAGWGPNTQNDFSSDGLGRLFRLSLPGGAKTLITPDPVGHLDGLESDRNGGYFVTDWTDGSVKRISSGGKVQVLLSGLKNAADLGYFARKRLLIVPEMGANRVTAYRVPPQQ